MEFIDLKRTLARRAGGSLSGSADVLYGDYLNETYRGILRKSWATQLRDTTTTVTSVAGTDTYSVSAARINRIWDPSNQLKLELRTLAWLRDVDPRPQQGTPVVWIPTDVTQTTMSFLLWQTPSAALTYTLDITSALTALTANDDEPLLPDDFHDLLVDGAELRLMVKKDDPERWTLVKNRFEEGQKDLRAWIVDHPDYRPVMGGTRQGISNLGPWYPADIYR